MTTVRAALKRNGIALDDWSPADFQVEEAVLVHSFKLGRGSETPESVDARVQFSLKLPDGTMLEVNETRRFRLNVTDPKLN